MEDDEGLEGERDELIKAKESIQMQLRKSYVKGGEVRHRMEEGNGGQEQGTMKAIEGSR